MPAMPATAAPIPIPSLAPLNKDGVEFEFKIGVEVGLASGVAMRFAVFFSKIEKVVKGRE